MGQRIEYIDAIRGFAIILVVMGHAIAWSYTDWHEVCLYHPSQPVNYMVGGVMWQVIYSFHMALFFMVSGYLSGGLIITKSNIWEKTKNKTVRLLIPYLATGYLIYFVRGNWGYWFLLTLFEMSLLWMVLSWLLSRINKERELWIDVAIMSVAYLLLRTINYVFPITGVVISANLLKSFIPFCFGTLMSRHDVVMNYVRNPRVFTFCLLLFFSLFITRYMTSLPILYKIVVKLDFYLSASALLVCVAVFHVFIGGINKCIERVLAYLGVVSLPIYILHILFLIQIPIIGDLFLSLNPVSSITLQIVISALFSAISIVLSIIIYKLLRRSAFFSLLLFGEK